MNTKALAVLLIASIMSLTLFAVVQAQPTVNTRGGVSLGASDLSFRKPSKPPAQGISDGVVASFSGNKYAIVIGISNYQYVNDLQYCDDDAEEFAAELSGYTTTTLIDGQATRSDIMAEITSLKTKVHENDQVVFFYSGHGSTGQFADNDAERKDECIIPYDAKTTSDFIWDGQLRDAFDGFSCRIMFYFDSCYAGGMTDLAGQNRLICMACGESQLSLESSVWEDHGQFTYYFLDIALKSENSPADKSADGQVTFEEAFDFAKANCQRQTPIANDGFTHDMLP